jgi:hypothetical protein
MPFRKIRVDFGGMNDNGACQFTNENQNSADNRAVYLIKSDRTGVLLVLLVS